MFRVELKGCWHKLQSIPDFSTAPVATVSEYAQADSVFSQISHHLLLRPVVKEDIFLKCFYKCWHWVQQLRHPLECWYAKHWVPKLESLLHSQSQMPVNVNLGRQQ